MLGSQDLDLHTLIKSEAEEERLYGRAPPNLHARAFAIILQVDSSNGHVRSNAALLHSLLT